MADLDMFIFGAFFLSFFMFNYQRCICLFVVRVAMILIDTVGVVLCYCCDSG